MKATIDGVEYEGTAREIAELKGLLSGLSEGVSANAPQDCEMLIQRWQSLAAAKPETLAAALSAVRQFQRFLKARNLALDEATSVDVSDWVAGRVGRCKHLYTYGEKTRTPDWVRCRVEKFGRVKEVPSSCSVQCDAFENHVGGAAKELAGVASFYAYHEDVLKNPVRNVLRRFNGAYSPQDRMERRYCPSLDQVRLMVRRALEPPGRVYVLLAAKSGRRPGELELVKWSMIDLEAGVIDMDSVRLERKRQAGRGRTKMHVHGCPYVFLDAEMLRVLHHYRAYCLRENFGDGLWGGRRAGMMVDAAIRDAGLWVDVGLGSKTRLTPHGFRHFFTTEMQRNAGADLDGVRSYVKWLRGDSMGDAMARYEHLDVHQHRARYLRLAPRLAV